jgi:hypothetical protein
VKRIPVPPEPLYSTLVVGGSKSNSQRAVQPAGRSDRSVDRFHNHVLCTVGSGFAWEDGNVLEAYCARASVLWHAQWRVGGDRTWQLDNVTFDDGGIATGSTDFDAQLAVGLACSAACPGLALDALVFNLSYAGAPGLSDPERILVLVLATDPSDAGGTVALF